MDLNELQRGQMKTERTGRYRDKLDMIVLRARQAQTWLDGDCPKDFLADDTAKMATYRAFQEAVEASMDFGGHDVQGSETQFSGGLQ
jgi:uncharacterized protein YutE (UPF0331/DUF86 family)